MLQASEFAAFFHEVHGVDPFPWQQRLLAELAGLGCWPAQLDLPTGSGKTAAIDIAVFHLALEAARGTVRVAPVRIAFVVDRRLVVDDAYARAIKLRDSLEAAAVGSVTARVATALRLLALDGPPLLVRRLRGGLPREGDWARTPSQPTVLCSTVDQIGSRLLFRGYGVSDSMKPVHAGLIGSDCLILLDEAHLAEPFRQTLEWVARYRGQPWREATHAAPWQVVLLTATPTPSEPAAVPAAHAFVLAAEDHAHPVLQRRLQTTKPARLRLEPGEDLRRQAFIEEARAALSCGARAVGVVLNRVARARDLFNDLRQSLGTGEADLLLLIGPSRPAQRDPLAALLDAIRTGAARDLRRPLVVVATQCIEAGVDIDLDVLLTEAAPLDALRQRFGRLNRNGRSDVTSYAVIIAVKDEVGARADDPVYGTALREAWADLLAAAPEQAARKRKTSGAVAAPTLDFGIAHFNVPLRPEAQTQPANAPVLMPMHMDLLAQTSPLPGADPEVALYLHGPVRQPDGVTLIWRADLNSELRGQDMRRLLTLVPPRAHEAIELPVWAVRRWLQNAAVGCDALADLPTAEPEESASSAAGRLVFRWRGSTDDSRWVPGSQIKAGDTIIVPTTYGGVDAYGWDPSYRQPATDLADAAAQHRRGVYFAVRVAPGLIGEVTTQRLSELLEASRDKPWDDVRSAIAALPLPAPDEQAYGVAALLKQLRGLGRRQVEMDFGVYGLTDDGRPRGVVFIVSRGLPDHRAFRRLPRHASSTESDIDGSVTGHTLSLRQHSLDVECKAEAFAHAAGLPPARVADLKLAGWLHDQGKADQRFQRWMHHGDPLGADPDDEDTVLAKSGRALPLDARDKAGLPHHWRHEALSVRLARRHERLWQAADADLVLWLVGTHHGHGRPLFPHADPTEPDDDVGPQSLAFDWQGRDWAGLFDLLRGRYGTWELARMEAILRLADHRASEAAAEEAASAAQQEERA
ncbi:MAG: hypothetical protein RLZZ598_1454 [Pseudomonadota bacterium]|jgi:CRISPR-associated endonuclease/helicase Cas3